MVPQLLLFYVEIIHVTSILCSFIDLWFFSLEVECAWRILKTVLHTCV